MNQDIEVLAGTYGRATIGKWVWVSQYSDQHGFMLPPTVRWDSGGGVNADPIVDELKRGNELAAQWRADIDKPAAEVLK